jgi:hypothetical protein
MRGSTVAMAWGNPLKDHRPKEEGNQSNGIIFKDIYWIC